jgi:hypothetical protein
MTSQKMKQKKTFQESNLLMNLTFITSSRKIQIKSNKHWKTIQSAYVFEYTLLKIIIIDFLLKTSAARFNDQLSASLLWIAFKKNTNDPDLWMVDKSSNFDH